MVLALAGPKLALEAFHIGIFFILDSMMTPSKEGSNILELVSLLAGILRGGEFDESHSQMIQ
jgi:LDH2 family malate/lactate/ureidoglycolate dehydrogenase